jgi:hypothetical protein
MTWNNVPHHHTTFSSFFRQSNNSHNVWGWKRIRFHLVKYKMKKHYNCKHQPYVNTTTIIILIILVANDVYRYNSGSFFIVTLGWMIFIH